MKNPIVIAEIGCNHKGDISIAKDMIRTARDFCHVNVVKFQKRTISNLLTKEEYNTPHPNPQNSYGKTYGEHREFLEFDLDQHKDIKEYCETLGMIYSSSVWDIDSARDICSLEPEFVKIPSATNTNYEMLEYLCEGYKGLIHISLGMTTRSEERYIVDLLDNRGRLGDTILYACTSGYPVPPEDVALLEIERLKREYGNGVHAIGFSGHHNGISIDMAAYTLGATYIERHYTLDRTWKGTDHAASLEPDGLRRLTRDLHNLHPALADKKKELLDIEIPQRNKLKWSRNDSAPVEIIQAEKIKSNTGDKIELFMLDVDGVLTDSGMYYTENGDELKKFNTRDGQGIEILRESGVKVGIITREKTDIVTRRAEKLKVDYVFQGVTNKLEKIKNLQMELKLKPDQIGYIGDDIHDLSALKYVGFSAVPKDAVVECRSIADYRCALKGGEGCVREFAEVVLRRNAEYAPSSAN
ncbi:MAG TPA: HAD-IIIA family hydrolase [Gammaproteobacteria bacterium]|nr:HAD-IIIA family hydrolase [Gammaproteobacteria bacterium]